MSIRLPDKKLFGLQNVAINFARRTIQNVPQGEEHDQPIKTGELGNPVYTDLTFEEGEWTDNGKTYKHEELVLDTVIMQVTQAKKIIRTDIQGKDGTVIEYIGLDNYVVTILGEITSANGVYPVDKVAILNNILKAPKRLAAVSWWLQQFDIDNIVISDYDLPQISGRYSSQPFTIQAMSDKDIYGLIENA